jgi:hypothetical protein
VTRHLERRGQGSTNRLPPILLDLAAMRSPAPWQLDQRLIATAREHRMGGLLWSWARNHDGDDELKRQLAVSDLRMQSHLLRVSSVLQTCVARLDTAGIDVITIKGVTSEARWYERRGERPCSDVDLLLPPHEIHRVRDVVRLLDPQHPWAAFVAELAVARDIQSVTLQVDGIEVDLHLDLLKLGIRTRQATDVWRSSRDHPLPDGRSVRVLDATTALTQMLVHLNKDRFQRLLGYADVARIVHAGQVDWEQLERFARREGLEVAVLRTLEAVLGELALPWPDGLDRPRSPRARMWDVLWSPRIRLRGSEGRLRFRKRQDWLAFLARGRAVEALRWWVRELWPPAPIVRTRYADIPGPYVWKVLRGRMRTARVQRETLLRRRTRSAAGVAQRAP